jgi:hypothetical protein
VDAVGEKGQTGRRPLRRERAKPLGRENPRVPGESDRKVGFNKGRKGKEKGKRKAFSSNPAEGEAREVRKLRRARGPDPI